MILNINQLRTFYLAAIHNSITIAAQELMVTPPAISKQLRQLENMLEMRLLRREGNSIKLTSVGKTVFGKCAGIFEQIHDLEKFFDEMSDAKSGILKIGCPPTAAKYWMSPLISKFKQKYPAVKIVLEHGTNYEMIQSILDQKNDLAILRPSPTEKAIKTKIFRVEEMVLFAAPESKSLPVNEISVPMLSEIPLIMTGKGSATRDVVLEYFNKLKKTPSVVLECSNIDLIKELVKKDEGVSFLTKTYIQEDIKMKRLKAVRILAETPTIEFGIGYLKRHLLSPAAWAFLRLVDTLNGKVT